MISRDMKVSKILDKYPYTLDVFIKASPHFHKLKNKILRKALAGRVTVEQAASIAGIDADYLLSRLNEAAGSSEPETDKNEIERGPGLNNTSDEKPYFMKSFSTEKITTLDVRPILLSGKDPLKDILSIVKQLKTGNVLLIINSFEPLPLYTVLKEKGFAHWSENENNVWKIYFYKENNEVYPDSNKPESNQIINIADYKNLVEVDVHDLPAPEPMIKILENLSAIDEESVMVVNHHREPNLLYPRLEERGYIAACTKLGEEKYQILIARKRKI